MDEYGESEDIVFVSFEKWLSAFHPFSFVADPICFDLGFIDIAMRDYFGDYKRLMPRLRGVDIRSLRMVYLNRCYIKSDRELVPKQEGVLDINHNALTDAINQAYQFVFLCNELGKRQ